MRNLKINRKRGKAELELNRDFYPERVLRNVAEDFGKVLDIDIEEEKDKFVVILKPKLSEIGIEKAAYEFVNYLLAEVKNDMVKV